MRYFSHFIVNRSKIRLFSMPYLSWQDVCFVRQSTSMPTNLRFCSHRNSSKVAVFTLKKQKILRHNPCYADSLYAGADWHFDLPTNICTTEWKIIRQIKFLDDKFAYGRQYIGFTDVFLLDNQFFILANLE